MTTQIMAETGKQDIFIKRSFNAETELVYKLFADKDLQIQWQQAFLKDFAFITFECANGGQYHSTHQGPDGQTFGFKGVYHEVVPYRRIIKTSEFLGLPFKVIPTLEILNFEESGHQTLLTIQIICDSTATRDAMLQHGMQLHFEAIFGTMDLLLSLFSSRYTIV